jgi:hypothetical protein
MELSSRWTPSWAIAIPACADWFARPCTNYRLHAKRHPRRICIAQSTRSVHTQLILQQPVGLTEPPNSPVFRTVRNGPLIWPTALQVNLHQGLLQWSRHAGNQIVDFGSLRI